MNHDVIIIGGSFAGLSAAMQLARARRRVLVIDAGRPRNRFAVASHGFLGQDGQSPQAIMDLGARQLLAYPTARMIGGEAISAWKTDGGFSVMLASGEALTARRLILAVGVADDLPPLPGLAERWGVGVMHCPYCHGYEVAGRDLAVLAYDARGVHQAMMLPDWGPTTLLAHDGFSPDADQAAGLAARGVAIETTPIARLTGPAPALAAVELVDGRVLPVAGLFVAPNTRIASPLAEQLGCAVEDGPMGPYLRVDDWKQTSVAGVFAAGDTAGPMHNATLAAAAGVMAGVGAHQSLMAAAISPAVSGSPYPAAPPAAPARAPATREHG